MLLLYCIDLVKLEMFWFSEKIKMTYNLGWWKYIPTNYNAHTPCTMHLDIHFI